MTFQLAVLSLKKKQSDLISDVQISKILSICVNQNGFCSRIVNSTPWLKLQSLHGIGKYLYLMIISTDFYYMLVVSI